MTENRPSRPLAPFADTAQMLWDLNLAPIPCPSADGKSPQGAVRHFNKWKHRPSLNFLRKLASKHGEANVGLVTSASRLTVVDVDAEWEMAVSLMDIFGDTPLITRTPSGGFHLFYRSNGESNANLRGYGYDADVKGTGAGVIIVPPSRRYSTGLPYEFVRGSWADVVSLPFIRTGAMEELTGKLTDVREPAARIFRISSRGRNDALFRFALRQARTAGTSEELRSRAEEENLKSPVPLDSSEVGDVVKSAWKMTMAGRNFVGTEARVTLEAGLLHRFSSLHCAPTVLWLYSVLRFAHGARGSEGRSFAVAPAAMAAKGLCSSLGEHRIRRALRILIEAGLLERSRLGGRGRNNPSLYRFTM